MNLKAAARRLDVHYQTLYRWVREGRIAAVKVGGRYDISEGAIASFLDGADGRVSAPDPAAEDADPAAVLEHLAAQPADSPYQAVLAAARFVSHHVGDIGAVHRIPTPGSVELIAIDAPIPALRARLVDIAAEMDLDALDLGDDGTSELVIEHVDQAKLDRALSPRARLLLEGVRVRSVARVPVHGHRGHCGAIVSFRISEFAHTSDDLATMHLAANYLGAAIRGAPPDAFDGIPTVTDP